MWRTCTAVRTGVGRGVCCRRWPRPILEQQRGHQALQLRQHLVEGVRLLILKGTPAGACLLRHRMLSCTPPAALGPGCAEVSCSPAQDQAQDA